MRAFRNLNQTIRGFSLLEIVMVLGTICCIATVILVVYPQISKARKAQAQTTQAGAAEPTKHTSQYIDPNGNGDEAECEAEAGCVRRYGQ